MCASALHSLHAAAVTYGCKKGRFGGHISALNTALLFPDPSLMVGGLESDRAMQLLKDFYKGTNSNAPHPKVKKVTAQLYL
jgi:tRNA(Arg) A34 adenosine deaminase TadA